MTAAGERHRVVVVGSGFGGLSAAKALRRADVDVTLVARTNHHVFQPLLDQVVAGILSEGGRYAARTIDRRVRGRTAAGPFRYRDRGSGAVVGRFRAIGVVAGVPVRGLLAWLLWLVLHLAYVTGFRNQLTATVHWAAAFLGRGPSERTTTERQASAAAALPRGPGLDRTAP